MKEDPGNEEVWKQDAKGTKFSENKTWMQNVNAEEQVHLGICDDTRVFVREKLHYLRLFEI